MGVVVATGLVLVLALGWTLLPFLPALREFRRPRDTDALSVKRDSQVDIRHFARGFEDYLGQQYIDLITRCRAGDAPVYGELASVGEGHGGAFVIFPGGDSVVDLGAEQREFCERLVLSAGDLRLPDDFVHAAEVQAAGDVVGGARSVYRAILAGGSLQLAAGSASMRWLHAGVDLSANAGCLLHGRVSADGRLRLDAGCRFERLHAPCVDFGTAEEASWSVPPVGDGGAAPLVPQDIPHLKDDSGGRWLVGKGLELKAGQVLATDVVVLGPAVLRAGSVVQGSLKSRGKMTLEHDVRVTGSLVGERDMVLGEACRIDGPVICEKTLTLRRGCVVGTTAQPSTVSARRLLVEPGVRCHGTVWAHDRGDVLAPWAPAAAPAGEKGQTA
jgi:predicted acyltransferase (DUF342 family)